MARSARTSATGTHMIVAMLVLLLPVLAITFAFTRDPEPPVPSVAYAPIAERAAAASDFPVLAPTALPDTWTCTKAEWLPAGAPGQAEPVIGDTWTMAFLTPDRMFIGLDQRATATDAFVDRRTRDGREDGESVVGGQSWTRYVSADGRTRSLVLLEDAATVVSGDLPYEALESFAATLEPAG